MQDTETLNIGPDAITSITVIDPCFQSYTITIILLHSKSLDASGLDEISLIRLQEIFFVGVFSAFYMNKKGEIFLTMEHSTKSKVSLNYKYY